MTRRLLTAVVMILALSMAAYAVPISPFNPRPVPVTIPSPAPGETDLQTILNAIFGAGVVDAVNDQSASAMWQTDALPPIADISPTLAFEYTAYAGAQEFGIFGGNDTGSIVSKAIFTGPSSPISRANVAWTDADSLVVTPISGAGVAAGSADGIAYDFFGFYLKTTSGLFYTFDVANPGSLPRALTYNRPSSSTWAIAFEDGTPGLGDADYNDIVVKVESIRPVPEPTSVLLLGTALLGTGLVIRKRFAR